MAVPRYKPAREFTWTQRVGRSPNSTSFTMGEQAWAEERLAAYEAWQNDARPGHQQGVIAKYPAGTALPDGVEEIEPEVPEEERKPSMGDPEWLRRHAPRRPKGGVRR